MFIEDEPPEDMPDTLGIYEGVPLIERTLDDTSLPDRITLFKGGLFSELAVVRTKLRVKFAWQCSTR